MVGKSTVRRRVAILLGTVCVVIFGVLAMAVAAREGYETAPYKVVESDGVIEIREYPDLVLASTTSKPEALGNDGSFMRLFRYISGDNTAAQKIAMTTPVFMEEKAAEAAGTMGFVVPQEVAKAGAPAPTHQDVALRTRAGGRFAVIMFSGTLEPKLAAQQEAILREWLQGRGLVGEERAERAGYDPPFIPGPLRRNEVLIRLKTPPAAPAAPAPPAPAKP